MGQYSISSFQFVLLNTEQLDCVNDEFVIPRPVRADNGGREYVVKLHEEFEEVVIVALVTVHSLQTAIDGVTGHLQFPVGHTAPGTVLSVRRTPFVTRL